MYKLNIRKYLVTQRKKKSTIWKNKKTKKNPGILFRTLVPLNIKLPKADIKSYAFCAWILLVEESRKERGAIPTRQPPPVQACPLCKQNLNRSTWGYRNKLWCACDLLWNLLCPRHVADSSEATLLFSECEHSSSLPLYDHRLFRRLHVTRTHIPQATLWMTQRWTTALKGQQSVTPGLCLCHQQATWGEPLCLLKVDPPCYAQSCTITAIWLYTILITPKREQSHTGQWSPSSPPAPNPWQPRVQLSVSMNSPLLGDVARLAFWWTAKLPPKVVITLNGSLLGIRIFSG